MAFSPFANPAFGGRSPSPFMAMGQRARYAGGGSLAERLRRRTAPKERPPAGYYDPALDAAERAGARGVGDLRIDTDTANERASTDFITGTGRIGEDEDTSLAAILQARTRGAEDHSSAVAGRRRSYDELARRQAEGARARGVSGGLLAQSLRKRTENEALEAAAQEQAFSRLTQDLDSSEAGVRRAASRGREDAGTGYQYGVDDRALGLARAEREQGFFSADTGEERFFQAAAAGYRPRRRRNRRGR